MTIETVGLITYHYPHLKTEQVAERLLQQGRYQLRFYALPFLPRKPREVLFSHRPDQSLSIEPEILAARHDIPYSSVETDEDIDDKCDVYLVIAGKILSANCVANKKIINCHPGIIPATRGLDAFKWAIYDSKPLGITLHYIDENVDAGEIISIFPTNVYASDTPETLARRHYETEVDLNARFDEFLDHPHNPFASIEEGEARMRMPQSKEAEMLERFPHYVERWGKEG